MITDHGSDRRGDIHRGCSGWLLKPVWCGVTQWNFYSLSSSWFASSKGNGHKLSKDCFHSTSVLLAFSCETRRGTKLRRTERKKSGIGEGTKEGMKKVQSWSVTSSESLLKSPCVIESRIGKGGIVKGLQVTQHSVVDPSTASSTLSISFPLYPLVPSLIPSRTTFILSLTLFFQPVIWNHRHQQRVNDSLKKVHLFLGLTANHRRGQFKKFFSRDFCLRSVSRHSFVSRINLTYVFESFLFSSIWIDKKGEEGVTEKEERKKEQERKWSWLMPEFSLYLVARECELLLRMSDYSRTRGKEKKKLV